MQNSLKLEHIFPHMVEMRRNFHQYPELAFEEVRTAEVIMDELKKLNIPYEYGGKGSGVVGRLNFKDENAPTIALRADMDALPGTENTGLSFSSRIKGKMHACGHDAHMAMLLGAAALLKESQPRGNVVFVFQPAEERGGGARVILESGMLKNVNAIFGVHVTHHYRVGEIMVADGVITAQSDQFSINVKGKGGHGARPHEAIDAVVITGLLITAIQTLVSREVNPVYPSVVTVGKIQAGSAPNVIAEEALLEGSIRTTLPSVRNQILEGLKRMTKALGDLHNADINISIKEGYPPVINTKRETEIASQAVRNLFGESSLMTMDHPSMGSEDFSFYLQKIPGCYVRLGARIEEHEYIPLHSPAFDIDEHVLKVGAAYFDEVVREAIRNYRRTYKAH